MARSKMNSVVGSGVKDNCSLHRWVLLKNSIIRSQPVNVPAVETNKIHDFTVHRCDEREEEEEDSVVEDEEDMFVFPDVGVFVDNGKASVQSSEAQWLDSLLESLGDEDEDDMDVQLSVSPTDYDDEPFSPPISPMSSSDDLISQSQYTSPPPRTVSLPVIYPPMPYPAFHPPLIHPFELDSTSLPLHSCDFTCDDPLPYADDIDDLSVPDAIEDTSDDESDAPPTPFTRSTSSLVDPASIPLPSERPRSRFHPQIFIDTDDSYFYPFELDPLPFADVHVHPSPLFDLQEC
ncbi:hypothetical protein JAAARDRAFT_33008 [Jaapia argillacea MUCL 33604]|uniref:Uncharacterized protein n=1 Tax=Jaapia argillacea MUCL 33604 TaxID=933084 RepID=A0A067PXP1_9AGAM|nr:hypothetical protein JAAARDRAFT_33008 [Jaapia argillacea MUCL 33604]